MITFLLLIAKVFLFGMPYYLLLGLINLFFVSIGRLFHRPRVLALLYYIVITFAYIYIYSFWGAYLKAIVMTYSDMFGKKWLLIFLCFISIIPWIKVIMKQSIEESTKLRSMTYYPSLIFSSGQEAYLQAITVNALNLIIFLPISFIIFLFTNTFHNSLFFELPKYLSKLFL